MVGLTVILFIRTCAIWANATWVKVLLATVYVGCAIPIFYVLAVSVKAFQCTSYHYRNAILTIFIVD